MDALLLSLRLALTTTLILGVLCPFLAWWMVRLTHAQLALVSSLITLPLILPPTVLGYYLLVFFAPDSVLGKLFIELTGTSLSFSFSGLVLGSLIYSFPFVMQPLIQAYRQFGIAYDQVFMSLGLSPFARFQRVLVPATMSPLLAGSIIGFAHTLGEFGLILLIGGNIPGETQVLSILLYHEVLLLNYTQANIIAGILLLCSIVSLFLCHLFQSPPQSIRV